jgi:biotin carboxyl carrier protein
MSTKIQTETAGSIWKLHVAKGDTVEEGQELMIMEVMKMEVPYEAPVAGAVTAVHVSEGDVVEEEQLVLEIG